MDSQEESSQPTPDWPRPGQVVECVWTKGTALTDGDVDRCVVEGQAACLPGISVIGDRVPDVAVRDTTVRGVNGTGVYCLGGRVSLANCDVRAALMAGVEALRSSRVEIRASRVCRNRGGGVVAHAGATCAAFGTTIAENRGGGNVGASCVWFGTITSHGASRRSAGNSLRTEKLFAERPFASGLGWNAHTRMSWSHSDALCSKSGRALGDAPSLARSKTRCAELERSACVLRAIAVMLHSTWLGKLRTRRCRSSWISARVSACGVSRVRAPGRLS